MKRTQVDNQKCLPAVRGRERYLEAVVYRNVTTIKPNQRNPRTHSRAQRRKIAHSIRRLGFINPIIIDSEGNILAGNGRYEAALSEGFTEVPSIQIDYLSEPEKRAYVIADNRTAELAGWDQEILTIELQELVTLGFDVEITGFETTEIDLLFDAHKAANEEDPAAEDVAPKPRRDRPAITKPNDLWVLNQHALLCADARDASAYETLLRNEPARLIFTDPPYNVRSRAIGGLGKTQHPDFKFASGEMTDPEYIQFLKAVFANMVRFSMDGSIHYICIDWRHVDLALAAGRLIYAEFKNLCVWVKNNGGMGTFYRSRHELVLVFKNGSAAHTNNFELGQKGRYRTNVWEYKGVNTFRAGRLDELAMHPTVKPVALVADAIKDCSHFRDIILDPFVGSGTTIIAAENTGRRARVMEIDPHYCDVAIRRWQTLTGKFAVHSESEVQFDELELRSRDALPAAE